MPLQYSDKGKVKNMKLKLKDNTEFEVISVNEQKIYDKNQSCGWRLSMVIMGLSNSEDFDIKFKEENISEITVTKEADIVKISGYKTVSSVNIVNLNQASIQLVKETE